MSCNHLYDCPRCSSVIDDLEAQAQVSAIKLKPMSTAPFDERVLVFIAGDVLNGVIVKNQGYVMCRPSYFPEKGYIRCDELQALFKEDDLLGWLPLPQLNESGNAVFGDVK